MRKIFLLIAGIWLAASGYSQVNDDSFDIGIWGGGIGYMGDIESHTLTKLKFPAFGAFGRYNFHPRTSARLMFLTGIAEAEGVFQNQPWSFDRWVQDLSLQVEFNYLKYQIGNKKTPFSSYVMAGLGFAYYHPVFTPTIPFGIGFKLNAGKRLGLGVEYQMRKIFDDRLDGLDDPLAKMSSVPNITYTDSYHNNDWTGFLGVFLTYKLIMWRNPCPAYDTNK